jgi:hypothetical protein
MSSPGNPPRQLFLRSSGVAEHEVMWIGRRPAALATAENPAATEAFAEAVTGTCADCGVEVQDYVAAAGPYGSWMIGLVRDSRRQRLVWNGREGRLVLEQATPGVDWDLLGEMSVTDRTAEGFTAAIRDLLAPRALTSPEG